MICEHYFSSHPEIKKPECTEAIWSNPANMYTPNNFQDGDETQKLLHYTFVF